MKYYIIKDKLQLKINANLINDTVKELVENFLFRVINVELIPVKGLFAATENSEKTDITSVTEKGIYIVGKTDKEVLDGLFRVLRLAEPCDFGEREKTVKIPTGEYADSSRVGYKMIHLCVFPESDLINLKKTVRLAGVLGYTHVIIETWGGIKFDCMQELGWKGFAYEKAEISQIIKEIRNLKMEPVPMVNCLGHASFSRVDIGKHVVLDQNVKLADYFLKYGWVWDFHKQKVKDLLKKVREELYELFGEGEFFHVGLDETYYDPKDKAERDEIYAYITELCETVKKEGRTPMLWGDMFLHSETLNAPRASYSCHAYTEESANKMLAAVPKYAVIADWHYRVQEYPWKTSVYLQKTGHKTIQCSWYDFKNDESAVETANLLGTSGIMLTTWHALVLSGKGVESIVRTSLAAFGEKPPVWTDGTLIAADLWRKVLYTGENYERCGFEKRQIAEYVDNFIVD